MKGRIHFPMIHCHWWKCYFQLWPTNSEHTYKIKKNSKPWRESRKKGSPIWCNASAWWQMLLRRGQKRCCATNSRKWASMEQKIWVSSGCLVSRIMFLILEVVNNMFYRKRSGWMLKVWCIRSQEHHLLQWVACRFLILQDSEKLSPVWKTANY